MSASVLVPPPPVALPREWPDEGVPVPTWKPGEPIVAYRLRPVHDELLNLVRVDELPMNAADALHPLEQDEMVPDSYHDAICRWVVNALRRHFARRRGARIFVDVNFHFACGEDPVRPDVALVLGVENQLELGGGSFNVFAEPPGVVVALVVEATSQGRRLIDFVGKREYYDRMGVRQFLLADVGSARPSLIDYRRNPATGRLERQPPTEGGRVQLAGADAFAFLEMVAEEGVPIEVAMPRLVVEGAAGERLPEYWEVMAQLDAVRARTAALIAQTEATRARTAELEAETAAILAGLAKAEGRDG